MLNSAIYATKITTMKMFQRETIVMVTGNYRGSAHTDCNLSYRLTNKIYVIFHNLRGYDSHLIMQKIGKFLKDINVIPNNMEKHMAFMIDKNLIFIDSFQFMKKSLSGLADDLSKASFYHTEKDVWHREPRLDNKEWRLSLWLYGCF